MHSVIKGLLDGMGCKKDGVLDINGALMRVYKVLLCYQT